MTSLRRVFFPLKSNIGWFQSYNLQKDMTNRVKLALLLYDELLIEDGTFEGQVLERGGSNFYHPPGSLPPESRNIEYERDIKPTKYALSLSEEGSSTYHTFLHGNTIERFKIDYYNIFNEIDIESYDFIEFGVIDKTNIPKEAETLIKQTSWHDQMLFKDFEENKFLRNLVIDNLNYDLVTSILLESAIILDPKHQELLRQKCKIPGDVLKFLPSKEDEVIKNLLTISVPNFEELSLQSVLDLREDELWKDFRKFVGCISNNITENPEILLDSEELQSQVKTAIIQELMKDIEKRYPSGNDLAIDLALGVTSLIPTFGILPTTVSAGNSIRKYFQQRSGWIAFLMKMKSKPTKRL